MVKDRKSFQESVDLEIVGVYTEDICPATDLESHVLVHEFDRTDADSEQNQTFEKTIGCNSPEAARDGCRAE
jgi:hypothetical protein